MFIFRWIRTILWIIGLGTVIYWGYQYFQADSHVREKVQNFRKSDEFKEGIKDLKTWTGEVFKGVGERLENDVTDDEKQELDEILRRELSGEKQETQKTRAEGTKPTEVKRETRNQ